MTAQVEQFNERYLAALADGCPRALTPVIAANLIAGRPWDTGYAKETT